MLSKLSPCNTLATVLLTVFTLALASAAWADSSERRDEIAQRTAERGAEIEQRRAEREAEIERRRAERKAEIEQRLAERKAEIEQRLAERRGGNPDPKTDETAPSVPTGLMVTALSCSKVTVSWDASKDNEGGSGMAGYKVYRSPGSVMTVSDQFTSLVSSASASTQYSFRVAAFDKEGNQSGKSVARKVITPSCTPTDTTPPSVPEGLTVTPLSCSEVELRWQASTDSGGSGVEGYEIYRDGSFRKEVSAPKTTTVNIGLEQETTYSYDVLAFDHAGNASSPSRTVTVTMPPCQIQSGPFVIGSVSGLGQVRGVAVDEASRLAAVVSSDLGLTVVDVDNPEKPKVESSLPLPASPSAVALEKGVAYVVEVDGSRYPARAVLAVVDLSIPAGPRLKARIELPGKATGAGVVVRGSLAYVAATDEGLQIVDVSDPFDPNLVSTVSVPGGLGGALAVDNGYAFMLSPVGGWLSIVDVVNPVYPSLLRTLPTMVVDLAVVDGVLYQCEGTAGIKMVDAGNPMALSLLGNYQLVSSDIVVSGGVAFAGGGLKISALDVSRPTRVELLDEIETPGAVLSLSVDGDLVVAGDRSSTLTVMSKAQ
jgi:chitodextrinase